MGKNAETEWRIAFSSDSSLLIEGPAGASIREMQAPLLSAFNSLLTLKESLPAVQNLHPAYLSLLVDFDPLQVDPLVFKGEIERALSRLGDHPSVFRRDIEIPVVYGGEVGPDLERVAQITGLDANEVIRLHAEAVYEVAFLGFAPGFPYLTGLSEKLVCPRQARPRLKVAAGSVAIAGLQTGIYPEEGPGGWQIIGRTELRLFEVGRVEPTLLRPGDRVKFVPQKWSGGSP